MEVFALVRTLRLLQTVVVVLRTVSHCEATSKSLGLEGVVRVAATNNADKLRRSGGQLLHRLLLAFRLECHHLAD